MKEGISKYDMSLPLPTAYSRFSPLVAQFHEAIKFK